MHGQTSQYLAMHAKDPVHWQEWNAKTLRLAQQLNKPLFISSGYYACHWCHVMQEENYQNLTTAALINQHFIAVKIDREINPELDNALVAFSKKTTGQGGWPQHAILTPNGAPFAAFIYLPNNDLNAYLNRLANLWQNQAQIIINLAETSESPTTHASKMPSEEHFKKALFQQLTQQKDELSGGITANKGTSKFPRAPLLNNLLTFSVDENTQEWLITTLDMMQSEHLIDHVHGGFYRYTIDPEWQIPHFEKMAYNSALLAKTYLLAAKKYNRDDYFKTAMRTFEYLRNHLFNENIGLYQSSQSAIDKNGIEGGDYLFTQQQLRSKLTLEEYQLVESAWSLNSPSPYEQGWHPRTIKHELWPSIQQKLSIDIATIPKDNKSVISWNGLILSALSQAAEQDKTGNYQAQAKDLASRLIAILQTKKAPRAVSLKSEYLGQANLEDYAFVLQGLYDYQRLTNSEEFKYQIAQLEARTKQLFYRDNAWQYEANPLIKNRLNMDYRKDGVLPSSLSIVCSLAAKATNLPSQKIILKSPVNYISYFASPPSRQCKAQ